MKEFEAYVQEHNELNNTSGQNWSEQLKRPIEELAEVSESKVSRGVQGSTKGVELQSDPGDPADKAALQQEGNIFIVEGRDPSHEHVFNEPGDWFINVHSDYHLCHDTRLATIKGKYKTGAQAASLLAESSQVFKFRFEADNDLTV